jgi:hypothetical protein
MSRSACATGTSWCCLFPLSSPPPPGRLSSIQNLWGSVQRVAGFGHALSLPACPTCRFALVSF